MVSIKTDAGMIRKHNEDYVDYIVSSEYELYVVADGMGGHNAGDVASKYAVESILKFIKENFYEYDNKNTLLENAIKFANTVIYTHSIKNDELFGMGTTVVALFKCENVLQIANVGDSGAYGIKDNRISKISIDHSLVQELLNGGSISEEEARKHPKKNIITRAVGTSKNVDVDIFNIRPSEYEGFLLCTDGLTNELTKEDIEKTLLEFKMNNNISGILVDMAKSKGGKDNVTVLLVGGEV